MRADWDRLDRIFAEALQRPADARARFVAQACETDEALRAEVMALLAASESSQAFMSGAAIDWLSRAMAADGYVFEPGERVGAYTVLRLLGTGGAGAVWRARDERLDRDVAIKVLWPSFAANPEQLRRFSAEARVAGALNHPHVLAVYDVGEHRGAPFLVSECLEGQSLRERLAAGPLPPAGAVQVALGVGRGLAAAHARGIVHRDLKPENVFLRSDDGVKILDFGLAKLQSPGSDDAGSARSSSLLMGTAGYLAPELLEGGDADARSDLSSLGVLVYEMLVGRRPFTGASTFETLHAVLTTDPPDLTAVRPDVPVPLARIVARLLAKAPHARFQSAADLVWALEQVANTAAGPPTAVAGETAVPDRRLRWPVALAMAGLAGVGLLAGWLLTTPPWSDEAPALALTRFSWTLPDGVWLDSAPVVSPDGRRLAFVGRNASGSRLFVRELARSDAVAIAGTEGAKQPFWSPDGSMVGFFANRRLVKIAVTGGAPVVVADARDARGGTWSPSGTIVFGPDLVGFGLSRVQADGGPVEIATMLDFPRGDVAHRWPWFLPDGVSVLYHVQSPDDERRGVHLARVDRPATAPGPALFRSESEAIYVTVPGGAHDALLYVNEGRVEVRWFDRERMTVTGDARALDIGASGHTLYHPVMLSASPDVLAFASAPVPFGRQLISIGRDGQGLDLEGDPEAQGWPRISPDGRLLLRQRIHPTRANPDIWVDDLVLGTRVRLTSSPWPDILPVWSPDGTRVAYVSGLPPGRPGERRLSIAAADGSGVLQTTLCPAEYCEPTDWLSDGRILLNVRTAGAADIWTMPADGGGEARPLLAEAAAERDARVSPDGRWMAYVSDEAGRPEVSIRQLSGASRRIVVSGSGGDQPVWRRDGAELFFVDPQGWLQSVPVRWAADGTPAFGRAVGLDLPPVGFGRWGTQYDVSPDGRRIYMLRRNEYPPPRETHVVFGWRALLEAGDGDEKTPGVLFAFRR